MKNNTSLNIFCNLSKINALKFIKNPLNIIFSICFPIVWLIIAYFSFGKNDFYVNGIYIKSFVFSFISMLILPAASIALINLPVCIGSDRINNRLKNYITLNVNKYSYIGSNILVNLIFYLITLSLIVILGNFAFGLFLSANIIFACYFLSILNFIFFAIIGMFLSQLAKTDKTNIMICLLVFYPVIFLTGLTIPDFVFDNNVIYDNANQWFKYLQFIIPGGQIYFIEQNILLSNLFNQDIFIWKIDFMSILFLVIEALIFLVLTVKMFKWK